MKIKILLFIMAGVIFGCAESTETQTVKIGGRYKIELPAFMDKAEGLNEAASLQYQNSLKEFYVIVIDEPKEAPNKSIIENGLADLYSSDLDGYAKLISESMKHNASLETIPALKKSKINNLDARLLDVTGMIEDVNAYWKIAFIEGKGRYYQIMVWTLAENRSKYEPQMQAIINSFKETDRSRSR